jgi:hypothetical protein
MCTLLMMVDHTYATISITEYSADETEGKKVKLSLVDQTNKNTCTSSFCAIHLMH